jgi:hypothetical protein
MAKQIQITYDCRDVHRLCGWWAARLGYVVADTDETVRDLLDAGVITAEDVMTYDGRLVFATAAAATDPDGVGPRLYFQAVGEPKSAKNRVHLDISRGDQGLDEAIAEYVAAGAAFIGYGEQPGNRWAVMADPEGNEFCIQ